MAPTSLKHSKSSEALGKPPLGVTTSTMAVRKKDPNAQKLWTIRMPADLLHELKVYAHENGMPMQTFAKYIMRSGLMHLKETGEIKADTQGEKELTAHMRRRAVEQAYEEGRLPIPKTNGAASRFRELVAEVEKDGPLEATVLAQAVPYDAGHDVVTPAEDLPDDAPFSDLSEVEAFLEGGSSLKASLSVAKQGTPIIVPEVDILAEIGGDQTLDTSRSEDSEMNEDDIADLISSF
jgi:hypothetical protein